MIWTIVIAAGRIGTIWAKKALVRKGFQTITSLGVMFAIVEIKKGNKRKHIINEQKREYKIY